jgi:hypothetical protein
MKGVSYITDDKNRKKAVVIELKTLEQHDQQLKDLFESIIADSRKNEPTVPWTEIKAKLKRKGKA